MRQKRQLVHVLVDQVGEVALVTISNKKAKILRFIISGVDGGPVVVRVVGNDTYHGSFTVTSNLEVHQADAGQDRLYPPPSP